MSQQLEQLLQGCTVKLTIPGKKSWGTGTGFFVAPELILTCHHVVRDSENGRVSVCWQNRENFEAVIERSFDKFDLALLKFSLPIDNLPCVYLDESGESFQADDSLYIYGYPEDFSGGASVTGECEGTAEDEQQLIKFKAAQIRPGLSGSPLLNQRTGKVCGIVKFTRDRSIDLGGGAVPTNKIFSQFPELKKLQQAFHFSDDRWKKLLPRPYIQTPLSKQEFRNRKALLENVKKFWVKGVLEKSLHDRVLIELNLEKRPDALVRPWNIVLQTSEEETAPLPQGTKVIDLFDEIGTGRTLLILGKPGSGKTTTLLELARDLIARAEQDIDCPIPVVFNLSSWAVKNKTFENWLVEELNKQYKVPKKIGQSLVKEDKLLLLLDGLDEIPAECREQSILDLNQFNQNSYSEIVVCSRIKDYEALSNHLNFQSVVCLKLLTPEQVHHYLNSLGSEVTGLKTLIEEEDALLELAKSPLMLNIMVLTYRGVAAEDLPQTNVIEERRKRLFDDYIERMLNYERIFSYQFASEDERQYSKSETKRWLVWLAQKMVQKSQTIFLIEQIQPAGLPSEKDKIIYRIVTGLILGVLSGLIAGLYFVCYYTLSQENNPIPEINTLTKLIAIGMLSGLTPGLIAGLLSLQSGRVIKGLISGTIFAISISFFDFFIYEQQIDIPPILLSAVLGGAIFSSIQTEIKPVESIEFNIDKLFESTTFFGFLGILYALIHLYIENFAPKKGYEYSVYEIIIFIMIGVFFGGFKMQNSIAPETVKPNQGIKRSLKYTVITFWSLVFSSMFVCWMIDFSFHFNPILICIGLVMGLLGGLAANESSGVVCIQHFTLRLILALPSKNYIPWDYADFLHYASRQILLREVGGGYIFIHRMLMEHFAQMRIE